MKTLVDKILKNKPLLNRTALEAYVLTHTDVYFSGNFMNNAIDGFDNFPVVVNFQVDYPVDTIVNPAWNKFIATFTEIDAQTCDAEITARLVQLHRLTGDKYILAEYKKLKNQEEGIAIHAEFDFLQFVYIIELELANAGIEKLSKISYCVGLVCDENIR